MSEGADLEIQNFKLKIASGNKNETRIRQLHHKIILYLYAGYDKVEICKKLHISKSQLRNHIVRIRKDEDVINLKFELK